MKTNELTYKTSTVFHEYGKAYKLNVTISLGDECKNRHCDFSITADLYENGKWSSGGCLHDTILKHFPEFEMFVKLHLCNRLGQPFNREGISYWFAKKSKEELCDEFLITEKQYECLLPAANNRLVFRYLLFETGVIENWKRYADKAIARLEQLTGNEWVNPYNEEQEQTIKPLSKEELTEIESMDVSENSLKLQEEEAKLDRMKKRRTEIIEQIDQEITKLETEKLIKLYILDSGVESNNFIYYPSSNEVVFNWLNYDKITQEEFIDFINGVDYSQLPEGINFKLKE